MWGWIIIVVGYIGTALAFRFLGGIGAAGKAISDWGRRSSEKRRAAVERRLQLGRSSNS